MRRTRPGVLVLGVIVGAVVGFFVDNALSASGQPTFTPAVSLPVLLVLLGAIVVVLAVPVARSTRGAAAPVNPFRAVRIAALAKASSIVGAAVGGFALGLLVFLLTREVTPSLGSMGAIIATAVCGGILVVAGLIAEQLCTIRKDDDDEQPGGDHPGLDASR